MEKHRLKDAVRVMVEEHGLERVERVLSDIRKSTVRGRSRGQSTNRTMQDPKTGRNQPKREKITAPVYVSKLMLASETKKLLEEVAIKYEEKVFLPTIGEIGNFCAIHGIKVPASPSRVSAIPRVFKFLAQLEPRDIQAILQANMFSGPSRLAPIADAIRRSSEQRAGMHFARERERSSATDSREVKGNLSPKPAMPSKT